MTIIHITISGLIVPCRSEPQPTACRQMELRAVSEWPDAARTALTGWWPHTGPLCQRWSTRSPENPTWWGRSDAEIPQCCARRGTEGNVKVRNLWACFEVEIRCIVFLRIALETVVLFLEWWKIKQMGVPYIPKPLRRCRRGCGRLSRPLGGKRTAFGRCRCIWCLSHLWIWYLAKYSLQLKCSSKVYFVK